MTEVSLKRMSSNSKTGEERAFQVGEWGWGRGIRSKGREMNTNILLMLFPFLNSQRFLILQGSPSPQPQSKIPALSHSTPQIYQACTSQPQNLQILPLQEYLVQNGEATLPAKIGATFPGSHGAFTLPLYRLIY